MNVEQKEIVLLPYPFTNQEGSKIRPALIVSNNFFNKKSDDCLAVPLTSVIKEELYSIFITQEDLQFGTLIKPSRIRADKIFSIDKSKIIMKIGALNDETFQEVKSELFKVF